MYEPSYLEIAARLHVVGFWASRAGDVMVVVALVAALTFAMRGLARRWRVAAVAIISSMVVLQVIAGVMAVVSTAYHYAAVQVPFRGAFMFEMFDIGSSIVLFPSPPDPQGIIAMYVYLPVVLLTWAVAWGVGRRRQQPEPAAEATVDA